jgi:outer membrane lipoprotein-sorting protein
MRKIFAALLMIMILAVGCGQNKAPEELTESNDEEITRTDDSSDITEVTQDRRTDSTAEEVIRFDKPTHLKIDTRYTMSVGGSEQLSTSTLYIVDDNMRIEGSSYGMTYAMVYNDEDQKTYMINDADKSVMVLAEDISDEGASGGDFLSFEDEPPFSSTDSIAQAYGNYEKMTYNGIPVYYVETEEYNDQVQTSGTLKMWLSQEYGYPIHMEMIANGEIIMMSDSTITDAFDDDASLFEMPSDYTLVDMNSMMNMDNIDLDAFDGAVQTE